MAASLDRPYVLRLYVTDASPKSARAIVNVRRLLDEHLADRYSLEILDIAEHVALATEDQIVCVPTLLRLAPPPARRIIGDMSDVGARAQGTGRPAAALTRPQGRAMGTDAPTPTTHADELERLRRDNQELESRLAEAEDTLAAIRSGDVDALIVGEDIYTLDSANAASNALRKDVLAQMQDAVLAFDVDDHVIFMNPAAERQYGCAASEALGRPRGDLFRERWADAEWRCAPARNCARSGSSRSESVHVRGDGREIHVESTMSRLRDDAQQPLGSLAVIRDIGDRVEARATLAAASAELARRERQFATLVENSPDIFARLDRRLRYLYVSPWWSATAACRRPSTSAARAPRWACPPSCRPTGSAPCARCSPPAAWRP